MLKQIALAAALAVVAAAGTTTSADAGYKHGWGHKKSFHSYSYRPYYGYRSYRPVYTYRYYKPTCSKYGWVWKHGYKVRTCLW